MPALDDYITDVLLRDLVGHDRRPSAFWSIFDSPQSRAAAAPPFKSATRSSPKTSAFQKVPSRQPQIAFHHQGKRHRRPALHGPHSLENLRAPQIHPHALKHYSFPPSKHASGSLGGQFKTLAASSPNDPCCEYRDRHAKRPIRSSAATQLFEPFFQNGLLAGRDAGEHNPHSHIGEQKHDFSACCKCGICARDSDHNLCALWRRIAHVQKASPALKSLVLALSFVSLAISVISASAMMG